MLRLPFASRIRPVSFPCDDRPVVLHEIDPALIARAAVALLMLAGWANEKERCVTARAKVRSIGRCGAAPWASHTHHLSGANHEPAANQLGLHPRR